MRGPRGDVVRLRPGVGVHRIRVLLCGLVEPGPAAGLTGGSGGAREREEVEDLTGGKGLLRSPSISSYYCQKT